MNPILLSVGVGPVQGFIARARKMRDLWFSSFVLSEIAKAAAQSIVEGAETQGGEAELVLPAPLADACLPEVVSNKILAVLSDVPDLPSLIKDVKTAAANRWQEFAQEAKREAEVIGIDQELWEEQVNDLPEVYAAWVPMFPGESFADARQRVERLLAGRKALRDFRPSKGRTGWVKSSLDGANESVWSNGGRSGNLRNEPLDAVGVVKRFGGGREAATFPTVVHMAISPWLRGTVVGSTSGRELLATIRNICKQHGQHAVNTERFPFLRDFPYDPSFLSPQGLERLIKNKQVEFEEDVVLSLREKVKKLFKIRKEPYSYYAILAADGDRMGEALSRIRDLSAQRQFSVALSNFSSEAKKIIHRNLGIPIYTGGDDVLAFLPEDRYLGAARELHDAFHQFLSPVESQGIQPSLSVGVAVVHQLEPLEDALELGRRAEKKAKDPDRNGFAVTVMTRSGGEDQTVRIRWDDRPDERLHLWSDSFLNGRLPSGLPYQLRELAWDYSHWNPEPTPEMLAADLGRFMKKKGIEDSSIQEKILDLFLWGALPGKGPKERVLEIARELIIARHLAGALSAAALQEHIFSGGEQVVSQS